MPRWIAALPAFAALAIGAGSPGVAAAAGAYEDRAAAWLATQPPGTPAAAFPLVDGTYKGLAETVSAQSPACPDARAGIVNIGDQRLILPYQPDVVFIAPVRADGSLSARLASPPPPARRGTARARAAARAAALAPPAPIGTLEGRVGAGWLEFTVRTAACETRYRLRWTM